MPSTFVQVLVDEHRGFKVMLSVLEAIAARLARQQEVPAPMLSGVVEFFETFTERHHGREEHTLFPVLERHGVTHDQTVIDVLLAQHDAGRAYCRKMRSDLARHLNGEPSGAEDFAAHARGYSELIREHIRIEDEYFYSLADKLMTHAERQTILDAFSDNDSQRAAGDDRERFLRMLDEYPGVVAGWR